ncbi:MAG: hypothetical protein JXR76_29930 [Deltaproteobacteria bacterium]|nr:hypothetical protein [Deltaproteobacteria bacterium]
MKMEHVCGAVLVWVLSITMVACMDTAGDSGLNGDDETEASQESLSSEDEDSDSKEFGRDTVSENDGTSQEDDCPDDSEKLSPGRCGCGISDNDEDNDGTPDCIDACPLNNAIQSFGKVTFKVVMAEDAGMPELHDDIERCLLAAGETWTARLVVPFDVLIDIFVDIKDISTANGRSSTTIFTHTDKETGLDVYQAGVAYEILTGVDPAEGEYDAEINWGITALNGEDGWKYWFDPDPWERTAYIPGNTLDATSTCLHEFGHVLGFTGWRDSYTGELPDNYASDYDLNTTTDGDDFYFNGPLAKAVYEDLIPETWNNIRHVGNLSPRPGEDLVYDLMRGTSTVPEHRYYISDLDLAILADTRLPVIGSPTAENICNSSVKKKAVSLLAKEATVLMTGPQLPLSD